MKRWANLALLGVFFLPLLTLSGAARAADAPPTFVLPPLATFSAIVERPLFSPSRRPSASSLLPTAASVSGHSLVLTGVVRGGPERRIGLIRDDETKSESRVRVGATVNGWSIVEIDNRGMTLEEGGQRLYLALKKAVPPAP